MNLWQTLVEKIGRVDEVATNAAAICGGTGCKLR